MPSKPGINDLAELFSAVYAVRKRYFNIVKIQIMPYYTAGAVKWGQAAMSYALPQAPAAQRGVWQTIADEVF